MVGAAEIAQAEFARVLFVVDGAVAEPTLDLAGYVLVLEENDGLCRQQLDNAAMDGGKRAERERGKRIGEDKPTRQERQREKLREREIRDHRRTQTVQNRTRKEEKRVSEISTGRPAVQSRLCLGL